MHQPPPADVIRSFGLDGVPVKLAGGEERTWRVGNGVLKQVERLNADYEAALIPSLPQIGYRLAQPIRSLDGRWTVDGWAAYSFVVGRVVKGHHLEERFAASRRFHQELRAALYSPHLDDQRDPWSIAQRVVFGTQSWEASPQIAEVWESLKDLDHAPRDNWQVIHADIAGNFLIEPGLDPAIIDLTLKWSPVGFAEAVMAVDVALWEGVPLEFLLGLLTPREIALIPLAASRRLLEIDVLHREGGRPATIFEQVAQYREFVDRVRTRIEA